MGLAALFAGIALIVGYAWWSVKDEAQALAERQQAAEKRKHRKRGGVNVYTVSEANVARRAS